MVNVTPTEDAKKNYNTGAAVAGTKYRDAVARVSNWQERAASEDAEQLYAAKTQEAIARKARQKGVSRTTNEEWKQKSMNEGANNISRGMQGASEKWARNWSPYGEALRSVSLPARSADPVANVQNRVVPIVQALANKKKEIS